MVKHIVMWTLKEKEQARELKSVILGMKGKVESLVDIECGINYNTSDAAFDLVLISVHNTKEDLEAYQSDPVHVAVAQKLKAAVSSRNVVDFEY